jgi:tetratricopeptide (TPR) repeat protein
MPLPEPKALTFLQDANALLRDVTRAVDVFTLRRIEREAAEELRDAPSGEVRGAVWSILHHVRARRREFVEALDAARNAVRNDATCATIWRGLGVAQLDVGQSEAARATLERALALASDRDDRLYILANLSEVLLRLGNRADAWRMMREAAQLGERSEDAVILGVLSWQHAAIDAIHDAAEYFARSLCLEHAEPRGDESALDIIERLEPGWRQRLAHGPKLMAAIEAVHVEE